MDLGVNFEFDDIKNVEKQEDIFVVTGDFKTYNAKTVIIATGSKHRTLGLEKKETLCYITKNNCIFATGM